MTMPSQTLLTAPSTTARNVQLSTQLCMLYVNASLACICHTRELINWSSDCFQKRFIDDISLEHEPEEIYDAFCRTDSSSTKPSQEVRVLVRSDNSRANSILDLVESGVFDALKHCHLHVLHIFVTSNAHGDNAILETYTYTFKYHGPHVTGVRIGETGEAFSLANSQKSFKAAIRALLRTMKDLPPLPRHRSLGMSMSFRADCPPLYQPFGFRSADNHSIAPDDWKRMWSGELDPVTVFEAAHHVVQIVARNKEYEQQTTSQLHDTLMSKQLHNMQRTSSNRNVGLLSTLPVHTTPLRNTETLKDIPVKIQSKRVRGDSASAHNETPSVEEAVKTSEAKPSPRRRRISISGRFIELNRSSPASGMTLDDDELDTYTSRQADQTDWSEEDFN